MVESVETHGQSDTYIFRYESITKHLCKQRKFNNTNVNSTDYRSAPEIIYHGSSRSKTLETLQESSVMNRFLSLIKAFQVTYFR